MKGYKKFAILFLTLPVLFVVLNFFVWKLYTRQLIMMDSGKRGIHFGDLTLLGYLTDISYTMDKGSPREPINELPGKHIESAEYDGRRIDIITIGDSFSNSARLGKNPSYQDYIASINEKNVMNIKKYHKTDNFLETLIILVNSGYLDSIKPKYLLLETVERTMVYEYCRRVDFSRTDSLEAVAKFYTPTPPPAPKNSAAAAPAQKVAGELKFGHIELQAKGMFDFINTGNFKFLFRNALYTCGINAFNPRVYLTRLDRQFFSVPPGNRLYFLDDDLKSIPTTTEAAVQVINENINRIASLLKQRGIELVFMPVPDKYSVYHQYIVENRYPKPVFFDFYSKLKHEHRVIDAKPILEEELRRGTQDLYFYDDTHWTWKAPARIFREEKFN